MTFKGVLATAVVLLAICLFARGQSTPAPTPRLAVHVTTPAHHAPAKKGTR